MSALGVIGHGLVVADVIPVAVGRDDELERPVARGQLVRDPGERRRRGVDGDRLARARVREDVDVRGGGPDDAGDVLHGGECRRSAAARPRVSHPTQERSGASSLVFMHSNVWPIILLAVPSIIRAPDARERAGQVDVRDPVHDRAAVAVVGQLHARVRVNRAAGRLAVRLDDRAIGRLELGELHVHVELGADEPDADLGRGLEMGRRRSRRSTRRRGRTDRPARGR